MVTLILGGSGSGKSAFAEDYIIKHNNGGKTYYLATMQSGDDPETRKRIERHQMMRNEKGFLTIEQSYIFRIQWTKWSRRRQFCWRIYPIFWQMKCF